MNTLISLIVCLFQTKYVKISKKKWNYVNISISFEVFDGSVMEFCCVNSKFVELNLSVHMFSALHNSFGLCFA